MPLNKLAFAICRHLPGYVLLAILMLASFSLCASKVAASQMDIAGPIGSANFGGSVIVLPNGNFVVVDSYYNLTDPAVASVGAVHLFNGTTLTLISTLSGSTRNDQIGSGGITVLSNGNFVVSSPVWTNPAGPFTSAGAVTWCSAVTGCSGPVSPANSLVGASSLDQVGVIFDASRSGVTALANGNYVVSSPWWNDRSSSRYEVGAATWCSGTRPTVGHITPVNSLVGGTNADHLSSFGVTSLPNGNYVVRTSTWSNPTTGKVGVGAVTWGNGSGGTVGFVSSENSLVGSSAFDSLGTQPVQVLTNGNYVVSSPLWDNISVGAIDAGAITWGNGTGGTVGIVSPSNSLVGGTVDDLVGQTGVTVLTNGNYVAKSPRWDQPSPVVIDAGAATWCSGLGGTVGLISSSNSLTGATAGDRVGNGVIALTNGNYVLSSPLWDGVSPALIDAGAATWGNGKGGSVGKVGPANSVTGSTMGDSVGNEVIALSNGNYVISSPSWDNPENSLANVGAVTWCNGQTETIGPVTLANSLVGGTPNDRVGGNLGVTALVNGNYVVTSPNWDNTRPTRKDAGAATWGNGFGGSIGLITPANSLVGGAANDKVGSGGVTKLVNGNYVVLSPTCHSPYSSAENAGAATWGRGTGGLVGPLTISNSLIGISRNDRVGINVAALPNGNYVVNSNDWDLPSSLNDPNITSSNVGAVTWADGAIGVFGLVTSGNSMIGSKPNERFSMLGPAFANGNYLIGSFFWSAPGFQSPNVGAVSLANGRAGGVGVYSGSNGVIGYVASGLGDVNFDLSRNRVLVGRPRNQVLSVFSVDTVAQSDGLISDPSVWSNGVPDGYLNGVVPNGRTVTLDGVTKVGYLSVGCSGRIDGASSSAYLIGNLNKDYCNAAGESFVYPVGDAFTYSPVVASNVAGTGSQFVSVTDTTLPGLLPGKSVSRYWSVWDSGIVSDLALTYADADINGSEAYYSSFYRSAGLLFKQGKFVFDPASNNLTVFGVSGNADWGIGVTRSRGGAVLSEAEVLGVNEK